MNVSLLLAFLLGACGRETACLDLTPDENLINHVQPYDVGVDTSRRRVWSTAQASRALAIIDADTFELVQTLSTGPKPLEDPEIALDGDGNAWIATSSAPCVARVGSSGDAPRWLDGVLDSTLFLDANEVGDAWVGHSTDVTRIFPEEGLLFHGGYAIDLATFSRRQSADLPVTRLVDRHPTLSGEWIGVDDPNAQLVRVSSEGEILGSESFADKDLHGSAFLIDSESRSVVMARSSQGVVCLFPVGEL